MKKEANLYNIMRQFAIGSSIEPCGNGHITSTYRVEIPRVLLQRINTDVFKNPDELMENIEKVTDYLREKIVEYDGDPERETMRIIKTVDGKNYYRDADDNVYRMYRFVDNTKIVEDDISYNDLYHAGIGFGKFQKMLKDFPVDILHETIPYFHHTPMRVQELKDAIENNVAGKVKLVEEEIDFVLKHEYLAGIVVDGIERGEIPIRVTHNDTKINNILFDRLSGEAICVIDLDTVMPGSVLYDFGDALRMGASTGAEDEVDLSKVQFDIEAFRKFSEGYLEEMREELTEKEMELLPVSAALLTYECGIRFLTDYLNGNIYFKVKRENHNLDRARNQFKLVEDILQKMDQLENIVDEFK